ncbi:SDR family NAD(P)-dependent oxidoreductase [Luteibacter sp. CQ10]
MASHQVHGFKVLPGLTYIDLIYQFFRRSGHRFDELELRHLAIHQPMVLPGNDDILVEIQAPEIRPGVWRVMVEGTRQQDGRAVADKACYAMAEMHRCEVRFDTDEDQAEPPMPQGRLDSDDIYATFRPRGLVHSGFMQVRGVGFSTPTHAFAEVGLSDEAKDSNAQYMFHPALLDGGVTCASGMLPGSDIDDGSPGGGLYIPLSYDGFRATSLVRGRCIARIDHSTLRRRNDLFLVTIDFLDEGGRKIAELRNLALKALRRQDAISEASGQSTTEDGAIVSLASGNRVPRAPTSVTKAPVANDTPNDATASLRELIASGIADRLGVSAADIDPAVGYYEMGLDSVGLLHLVKLLEERFGMSLSPTLLFEYTTIDELADHLMERYGDALAAAPSGASAPVAIAAAATGAAVGPRPSARDPMRDEPIAIIGMAGRFPQAKDIGELWQNLKAGKDCITEVPSDRWDWHLFDGIEAIAGRQVSRWGGFVADVDRFDARFFRVTPRAAEAIDPQERLFLEVSWEAVEDAGYTPRNLVPPHGAGQRRPVGVFAGVMHKDYLLWQAQRLFDGQLQSLAMSNAPIANRVSYFCNFHGPSVVVDTLCSSSLTAVHMATESLRQGECQVALAGGVNLSLHPGKYLTFALLGMHSSDGRCRTFGEGGDGYVAGEGVGVVVLKPLARAVADNDHVYAVIRGSTVNHVGAVSGISVPSPVAQADLIADCMAKAGVDPRGIGYVEAHGTGTALGDPIEIEGLGRAFRAGTDAVGYCAIGSIKSNMGHTESAAGIAGIIKVALQLHHATLVPSLHGERPNPHIDWATTPFVVQTRTAPWEPPRLPVDGVETVLPRRGAVSSFGAAGSNAHAILEEHIERDDPFRAPPSMPAIVPLSAQTPAQLRESARRLLAHLADGDAVVSGNHLHRLAHTLQRGREAHAHRVAFVAGDLASLRQALRAFLDEATDGHEVFEGAVSPSGRGNGGGTVSSPVGIRSALAEGRYADVARAWTTGDTVEWSAVYADPAPRRLSLPTYPFAGERYWVEESAAVPRRGPSAAGPRSMLHPALHENTSSLDEQRFTSRFDGTEFFFRDHVVNGAPVLPGVAYLEMAHAALVRATGDASPTRWRLRNAIWAQPIIATGGVAAVHVGVYRMPSGELGCEIFAGEGAQRTIHFQCAATPCADAPPRIDLDALRASCDAELPVTECYELLEAGGLRYGDAFRSMRRVWMGEEAERAPVVLARLELPEVVRPDADRFELHPAILDGALQASLGLMRVPGDPSAASARMTPYVPYALETLEVFAACHGAAYAVIRNGAGGGAALRKLEVTLCDDVGNVLVRMRGFAARRMEGGDRAAAPTEPLTFQERWDEAPPPTDAMPSGRIVCVHALATSRDVFDGADPTVAFRVLPDDATPHPEDLGAADALVVLWAVERPPVPADMPALIALLRAAALADPPPSRIVLAALCRTPMERACVDAWIALVPSLRRIAPYTLQIVGSVVDANADTRSAMRNAFGNALRELADPAATSVFHEDGMRRVRRMVPTARTNARPVLREGGTYLVTGGLGGLGGHLAAYLARRYRATLLLISRSTPDAAAQARMREWEANGARVVHARADVADVASLRAAVEATPEIGGRIDGIFHAAGIGATGSLFDSPPEAIERVLAPKVAGTLALEEAFAGHALDFICHFSSSSAVLGDFGACAYAVANRFQSACAAAAPAGARRVAIQWPLWRDGGLGMGDAEATAAYLASSGQRVLETTEGIDLLERLLGDDHGVHLVLAGEDGPLRRLLASAGVGVDSPAARPASPVMPAPSSDPLAARMLRALRTLLGEAVKLPLDRVSADTPLDDFGFDSILAMQMTNELEKSFGSLSKTLFFEYHDLGSLNDYLLREHRPAVARLLGVGADVPTAATAAVAAPLRPTRATASVPSIPDGHAVPDEGIAIVGFSGRFPQAADLDAFWCNLRAGTDSITEIPAERWDHAARFDPRKAVFGKTYCRWGGFLDDVDAFDPLFFNMTPVEARFTDPQQRLYLETVWNLLEGSGYTRDALREEYAGNVGVYVGSMYNQYGATSDDEGVDALGTSPQAAIANRVSYFFGLQGPSIAVDTMCSSAFAAIHMACMDLRAGVCPLAIAGGVNLSVHPKKYITLGQAQMLASQSSGRSFGQTDGYLPAEAVGAVLLKPLSRAIEDADTILGVIGGSAVNHGGRSNGYSVPNPDAQAAVMRSALRQARVSPASIGYVEAAANGSPLGDAIELAALRTVFSGLPAHGCAIGAVKSNIGHAEAASGMAQLAKVLLQMRHGEWVPTIQTEPPNPAIVLDGSPFRLPRAVEPWPRERGRTALINSFGAGGSNACLVVSEYASPPVDAVPVEPFADRHVLVVSARSVERLRALVSALVDAIDADPQMSLGDLAYTLQCGREAMAQRLALVVGDRAALRAAFDAWLAGDERPVPGAIVFDGGPAEAAAFQSFTSGSAGTALLETFLREADAEKLAMFWARGGKVPWARLHPRRRRILTLPGYPFARERHWLPSASSTAEVPAVTRPDAPRRVETIESDGRRSVPVLHPLLQVNSSDIGEYRFSSTFSGEEGWAARDEVRGLRLLPDALCLEMLRAAVERLTGGPGTAVRLLDLRWNGPVEIASAPVTVHVGMRPAAAGRLDVEVYSLTPGDGDGSRRTHLRCMAVAADDPAEKGDDLAPWRDRATNRMPAPQWIAMMRRIGLAFGEPYQREGEVASGADEGDRRYAVVDIPMPPIVAAVDAGFGLPLALMNIALQAAALQVARSGEDERTIVLPAALACRDLWMGGRLAEARSAWIRRGDAGDGQAVVVDIDLLDAAGVRVARCRGVRDGAGASLRDAEADGHAATGGYAIGSASLLALSHRDVAAPRNELETTLLGIWREALGFSSIGIFDTFLDLGGSSLLAARVVAMIDEHYRVTIEVPALLRPDGTIARLSELLVMELARQVAAESDG